MAAAPPQPRFSFQRRAGSTNANRAPLAILAKATAYSTASLGHGSRRARHSTTPETASIAAAAPNTPSDPTGAKRAAVPATDAAARPISESRGVRSNPPLGAIRPRQRVRR